MFPSKISLTDDHCLEIYWDDGLVQNISAVSLRDACPCANCNEKRRAGNSPVNPPADQANPDGGFQLPIVTGPLSIEQISPVGNYAYSIQFSDGHQTGIFSLDYLRSLTG